MADLLAALDLIEQHTALDDEPADRDFDNGYAAGRNARREEVIDLLRAHHEPPSSLDALFALLVQQLPAAEVYRDVQTLRTEVLRHFLSLPMDTFRRDSVKFVAASVEFNGRRHPERVEDTCLRALRRLPLVRVRQEFTTQGEALSRLELTFRAAIERRLKEVDP